MRSREPRLSLQTLRVLSALVDAAPIELAGADIAKATGIASGTLYPILMRLEEAKWLGSRWEELDPKSAGRPRRRFYNVTLLGLQRAQKALNSLSRGAPGVPVWARGPQWEF